MRSRKSQRGQALVESGLVLLVFLPVFIGIMDFGQFLYLNQTLWERTRVAARYGAAAKFTDGSAVVNVAIYNDPAGAANGATPTLPNLQGNNSSGDGYVTATLTSPDSDGNKRIVVTVKHYLTIFSSCRAIRIFAPSQIPNLTKDRKPAPSRISLQHPLAGIGPSVAVARQACSAIDCDKAAIM